MATVAYLLFSVLIAEGDLRVEPRGLFDTLSECKTEGRNKVEAETIAVDPDGLGVGQTTFFSCVQVFGARD